MTNTKQWSQIEMWDAASGEKLDDYDTVDALQCLVEYGHHAGAYMCPPTGDHVADIAYGPAETDIDWTDFPYRDGPEHY